MTVKEPIPADETVTFQPDPAPTAPPDLRFVHYNDVYHVDASSAEPVGGIARFQTLVNQYRNGEEFRDQSKLLTFFSGDAFNPSLESSVTKGMFFKACSVGRRSAKRAAASIFLGR